MSHAALLVLVLSVALASVGAGHLRKRNAPVKVYDIIIDAGSSGSRIRLYESMTVADRATLPTYSNFFSYKVEPGISQFKVANLDGVEPYLTDLINHGKEHIPEESWSSTPIYLMATAGMRLLLEPRSNAVMWKIQEVLADPDVSPFQFDDHHARILSGEEEGAFAWIATNYLMGYFDDPDAKESTGIVEMGGASAQIAFVPDGSILANKFPLRLAARNYALYVHSLLYYGQNYADLWVKEYLYRERQQTSLLNPCMLKGDNATHTISDQVVQFSGSGDPDACLVVLNQYVYKVLPYKCYPKPCSLGTTYQPTIPDHEMFVALGAYSYSLRAVGALEEDGTFTPEDTLTAAKEFCQKEVSVLLEADPSIAKYIGKYCLMGLYIPLLSTKAYGFDDDSHQTAAKFDIDGQPAEWALGAVIYESQRTNAHPVTDSAAVTLANHLVIVAASLVVGSTYLL